ncbi:MAG: WYL domain-containing protein [Bacteroidota bacterium]
MAQNKNALIRYRTIDKCLQNRSRRWTLNDLIEACSQALYEFEGKESPVSKRTVQLDIQFMRSDKLGYAAPIIVYDRKYYTYEDEDYTITDIPLTQTDMDILAESMEVLKQFKDFSLFAELNGVIQKLEDKIHRESGSGDAIIHIEKNEQLRGLEHLDTIYQSIQKQIVLEIDYRSFKSRNPGKMVFHPYVLKEFNNRWFLLGKKKGAPQILTLALDRIERLTPLLAKAYKKDPFDPNEYYKNTYGVTVMGDKALLNIQLEIDPQNAPYVLTKPFHHSQQLLEQLPDGRIIIGLKLHHNYELERLILGFGRGAKVLQPRNLRRRIVYLLKKAVEQYEGQDAKSTKKVQ